MKTAYKGHGIDPKIPKRKPLTVQAWFFLGYVSGAVTVFVHLMFFAWMGRH